jgi:beta-glucanase (GH16 family)
MSSSAAYAVKSGEFYTADSYGYGRVEARIQFAAGDGVVSAFFLWKDGSEKDDVFWNELDFEKIGADCQLASNAFYGLPERVHTEDHDVQIDPCGTFHTYTYEWTPEYIAWFVDGMELRRETGEAVQAFAENAADGMQIRFNIWPGDSTFGGNFDPAILPVHQYINWVQYSSYINGTFQLEWREDFAASTRPSGWNAGSWDSAKGLSTHSSANINFVDGYAIVSLTADDATGSAGAIPMDPEGPGPLEAPAPTAPTATGTAPAPGTSGMPVQPMPTGVSSSDADSGGCRLAAGPRDGSASWPWLLLGAAWGAMRLRRRHTRS